MKSIIRRYLWQLLGVDYSHIQKVVDCVFLKSDSFTTIGKKTYNNNALVYRWSDAPDYCVVGGVPAKLIKETCSQVEAATMKRIAWWDWTGERIKECVADFRLSIPEFIAKHQ